MFVERLLTPHPHIAAGVQREPILESVRFKTAKAVFESSDGVYEDQVEAAYSVAHIVRQSLWYEAHEPSEPPLSPDALAESMHATCHGLSIVASEALEELSIPHWIGYANQHSFLLMQDPETARVNMIDTGSKGLYADITPAFFGEALGAQDPATRFNFLRGDVVMERSQYSDKAVEFFNRPWLSFANRRLDADRFKSEGEIIKAHTLMLRTYDPELGRKILLSYANFIHAMRGDNFEGAHEWLQPLDGLYPDVDRRNKLKFPSRLIRSFARIARASEALEDIAIIERSLTMTQDLSMRLWPIDQRQYVAWVNGDGELSRSTLGEYDEVWQSRRDAQLSTKAIEQRIKVVKQRL